MDRSNSIRAIRLFGLCAALAIAHPAAAQDTAEPLPAVTLFTAQTDEVKAIVSVSGTLRPRNEVYVTPRIGGQQVLQVTADIGDRVTQGQVVVRLDRSTVEAEHAQAAAEIGRARAAIGQAENQIDTTAAELSRAEAAIARARELRDNGNLAQAAFDDIEAGYLAANAAAASARDGLLIANAAREQAEAQLKIAELKLSWTEIAAPVDGIVTSRNVNIGELTSLGSGPLMTIVENGTIELEAEVIETALGDIRPGDAADLEVAGVGTLVGIVRSVSPTVDDTTRLGTVMITLEDRSTLRAGIFASGQVVTATRDAVTVPVTAVLSGTDGTFVQTVVDGVVHAQAVVPGVVWQNRREIVSGLDEGARVIARAGAFFRDGDRVREVAE